MAKDPAVDWGPDASIEYHVLDLALLRDTSSWAVRTCMDRYAEAGPHLRLALERSADGGEADDAMGPGLFRALHIMGGMRDAQAFAPLLRLLARPAEDLEWLGDALTETLPKIVAGVFDGNAGALFDAIADQNRDELVRDSLLRAAAFLTCEGRIDRALMIDFLRRFGTGELSVDGEFVWHAWVDAIAVLGLRDLQPLVMEALEKGRIDEFIFEREAFEDILERSESSPSDPSRFAGLGMGYIEDVVDLLQDYVPVDDESDDVGSLSTDESLASQPAINPWRHVGRNDPCPCGSGKKAKRCCLAA
jgi:hypothetical protein